MMNDSGVREAFEVSMIQMASNGSMVQAIAKVLVTDEQVMKKVARLVVNQLDGGQ